MASIASTDAADARPACGSRPSPPRRASLSGRDQEASLPDAAAVEAMLAIALFPAAVLSFADFCCNLWSLRKAATSLLPAVERGDAPGVVSTKDDRQPASPCRPERYQSPEP